MMRYTLSLTLCAALLTGTVLAAESVGDLPKQPTWCQAGWVCVPTGWLAQRTANVWRLRAELERSKKDRFGLTVGCGFVVAGVVASDWRTSIAPAGACGIMYGLRF